jgi:uncharacterized membrane protein
VNGRWLATYFGVLALLLAYDARKANDSLSWEGFLLCIVACLLFMWSHRPHRNDNANKAKGLT